MSFHQINAMNYASLEHSLNEIQTLFGIKGKSGKQSLLSKIQISLFLPTQHENSPVLFSSADTKFLMDCYTESEREDNFQFYFV